MGRLGPAGMLDEDTMYRTGREQRRAAMMAGGSLIAGALLVVTPPPCAVVLPHPDNTSDEDPEFAGVDRRTGQHPIDGTAGGPDYGRCCRVFARGVHGPDQWWTRPACNRSRPDRSIDR